MPAIRTFIALDTPEVIRGEIQTLQAELKKSGADVKWESLQKFHATIKFLGDVQEMMMDRLLQRIRQAVAASPCFEVVFESLGCFPNIHNPRVIWVGCHNADGTLGALKSRLDADLIPLGFEAEDRAFHPHITLGRVKSSGGIRNLTPMLEKLTFQPRNAAITEILVMKSVLKREGSEYSIIESIPLHSAP